MRILVGHVIKIVSLFVTCNAELILHSNQGVTDESIWSVSTSSVFKMTTILTPDLTANPKTIKMETTLLPSGKGKITQNIVRGLIYETRWRGNEGRNELRIQCNEATVTGGPVCKQKISGDAKFFETIWSAEPKWEIALEGGKFVSATASCIIYEDTFCQKIGFYEEYSYNDGGSERIFIDLLYGTLFGLEVNGEMYATNHTSTVEIRSVDEIKFVVASIESARRNSLYRVSVTDTDKNSHECQLGEIQEKNESCILIQTWTLICPSTALASATKIRYQLVSVDGETLEIVELKLNIGHAQSSSQSGSTTPSGDDGLPNKKGEDQSGVADEDANEGGAVESSQSASTTATGNDGPPNDIGGRQNGAGNPVEAKPTKATDSDEDDDQQSPTQTKKKNMRTEDKTASDSAVGSASFGVIMTFVAIQAMLYV